VDLLARARVGAVEHSVTDEVVELLFDETALGQRAALVLLASDAGLRARLAALLANDKLRRPPAGGHGRR